MADEIKILIAEDDPVSRQILQKLSNNGNTPS